MSGPERIWVDQTRRWLPAECGLDEASVLDWRINEVPVSKATEYLRADLHQSALRAAREKALREAAEMVRRVYQLSLSDLAEVVKWADDIGEVIAHDIEQMIDGEKP